MLQKLSLFICLLLLLSSCWWDESQTLISQDLDSGLELFVESDFSIAIPRSWTNIADTSWLLPNPHTGKIELAARSDETLAGLANNILVLSDTLRAGVWAEDFLTFNEQNLSQYYYRYTLLDKKQIEYSDTVGWTLLRFEAKYNKSTPNIQFLQATRVCPNNKAYTITIALPSVERESEKYQDIIQTFSCL